MTIDWGFGENRVNSYLPMCQSWLDSMCVFSGNFGRCQSKEFHLPQVVTVKVTATKGTVARNVTIHVRCSEGTTEMGASHSHLRTLRIEVDSQASLLQREISPWNMVRDSRLQHITAIKSCFASTWEWHPKATWVEWSTVSFPLGSSQTGSSTGSGRHDSLGVSQLGSKELPHW